MTDQQPHGPRQPAPQPPQPPQQPFGYPPQPPAPQPAGYPQQPPPPQPAPPGAPKRKMSKGAVIGLVIALVVGIPVIGLGILIGVRLVSDISATNEDRLALPAEMLIPGEADAFLDDRYADGFRSVEVEGVLGKVLGVTADRSQVIAFVHAGLGNRGNENAWVAIDVASGEVVFRQEVQNCSNITPQDTIFCTRSVTGEGGTVRAFAEVDVTTGNAVANRQLPDIGTASIQFLGRNASGDAIVTLESQDGLGAPIYRHLYALPSEDADARWVTDLSPNGEWVEGCGIFDDLSVVACTSRDLSDTSLDATDDAIPGMDTAETTVVTFDPMTGEPSASFDVPSAPVFAADGVAVTIPQTGGIRMGESDDGTRTLAYDYTGEVIFESPDYLGVTLYPTPKHASDAFPQVTYPLETLQHGSNLNHYVVDANGEVVVKSEYQITDSVGEAEQFTRQTDGTVMFTGEPMAVTADGAAVLYREDFFDESAHLIGVTSGEEIAEIVPGGLNPMVSVERGIILYETGDSIAFLIPGR